MGKRDLTIGWIVGGTCAAAVLVIFVAVVAGRRLAPRGRRA